MLAVDPSRFRQVFAESGARDFLSVARRVLRPARSGGLHLGGPGGLDGAVGFHVDAECPWYHANAHWLAAAPAQHGAAGLGFGDRDDDVQHQLHALERGLAAVVGEAAVAIAPKAAWQQVAEHQIMGPYRIRLIGSVHRGSLVSRETASGGRTDRVRETRVDQAAA